MDYMNERYGISEKKDSPDEVAVPDTAVRISAASDDDLPF
jgi:hypothetical protein